MKKEVTLKLVMFDRKAELGDLCVDSVFGRLFLVTDMTQTDPFGLVNESGKLTEYNVPLADLKVVKPYGVLAVGGPERGLLEEGDMVIETLNNNEITTYNPHSLNQRSMGCVKVVLQAEEINYEDILTLRLRDGDPFDIECDVVFQPSDNTADMPVRLVADKAIISKTASQRFWCKTEALGTRRQMIDSLYELISYLETTPDDQLPCKEMEDDIITVNIGVSDIKRAEA